MCFSASASFIAGIGLTGVGVMSLKKTSNKNQTMFASIPLIFGIQQLTEGMVWLSFSNVDIMVYREMFTYGFLFFAETLWPFWVPVSVLLIEKNPFRKKILTYITIAGSALSAYLLYCLCLFKVEAQVCSHHIFYDLDFPKGVSIYGAIIYYLTTVLAPIISSNRKVQWFGFGVLIAYILARVFFEYSRISVWCFFAAIVSVWILYLLNDEKNKQLALINK